MPNYLFQSNKTGELKEFFFHMNDKKEVEGFTRVWTNPHAQIDTVIDANSCNDFLEKTKKKNYSVGDMWELSEKASKQREKSHGLDPIKINTIKEYEKKTELKHPLKNPKPSKIEI